MLKLEVKSGICARLLERRHAEKFYAFVERGRAHFENWIPFVSAMSSVEAAHAKISRYLELFREGSGYFWGLWDTDRIVGLILIKDIDEEAKTAEIGYMIDEEYEGRGIITESCRLMIDFIFGELNLRKVVLSCDDNNERSIGIARHFDFELEGILKQNAVINGRLRNTMCWGLINGGM
ncbi:MAG TPA: GNAT family protein [Rectinemataceae bacterium]|nr:GNAT family protein [Rectinemataceae bacterium]